MKNSSLLNLKHLDFTAIHISLSFLFHISVIVNFEQFELKTLVQEGVKVYQT